MTKSSNGRTESSAQECVLAAIGRVAELCREALPDAAVEHEIRELAALKSAVEESWPLPSSVKREIDLGPFAAKNISDWNPALADALMHLDYALQHDGESLEPVLPEAATPRQRPVRDANTHLPRPKEQNVRLSR
jgi:hypothetical protein